MKKVYITFITADMSHLENSVEPRLLMKQFYTMMSDLNTS
jgi:hypothetical protein